MEQCIFCKIAAGEIPSATLFEDEKVRVILDLGPAARGHALVLPKEHFQDARFMPEELMGHAMAVGARIGAAQMQAFGYEGFNLVHNNGEAAGQSVFHFHMHLIPRYKNDGAGVGWKPGKLTDEAKEEILSKVSL